MLKVGDTVQCSGLYDTDNPTAHPTVPFHFQVVDMDAHGNPIDRAGFIHPAGMCTLVTPNG